MSSYYLCMTMDNTKWKENIILADADLMDKVAFDLTVNFERMLERRIPQADLATWIECAAMDGGLRDGKHETQAVFMHNSGTTEMTNFTPGKFSDIDGHAFSGRLGEILMSCVGVEPMVTKEQLMAEAVQTIAADSGVKRIVIVADTEETADSLRSVLSRTDTDKRITLLTMQPTAMANCQQQMLGYSLMAAMGIRSEEISKKL